MYGALPTRLPVHWTSTNNAEIQSFDTVTGAMISFRCKFLSSFSTIRNKFNCRRDWKSCSS